MQNSTQKKLLVVSLMTAISMGNSTAEARTTNQNKGSDTLVNVAEAWAASYPTVEHHVAVAISGGGSGTGIAAMINGTVDIANASREMKKKKFHMATKRGQNPVEHVAGYDTLAVYLHQDNPANTVTFEQLKDVFARD